MRRYRRHIANRSHKCFVILFGSILAITVMISVTFFQSPNMAVEDRTTKSFPRENNPRQARAPPDEVMINQPNKTCIIVGENDHKQQPQAMSPLVHGQTKHVEIDLSILTNSTLTIPSIFNYLPHLIEHQSELDPIRPNNYSYIARRRPLIAIGIPTVRRIAHFYLLKTLNSLLKGLSKTEKDKIVLIVYIGEKDLKLIDEVMANLHQEFSNEIRDGLINVIAPPSVYYPELDNLPSTFGDAKDRVKWRAKQNLDYAYLMMYAQNKARYYMQLEDDVIAAPGYIGKIEAFARNRDPSWFMLEFCRLGFIGKMFHSQDLNMLVEFFLMFYKQKPNDWLLDHYIEVRVCSPEKGRKECNAAKKAISITSKPSLFQHIGRESSLKGKTQKLIDRGFLANKKQAIKENQFVPHSNPRAEVNSNCVEYSRFHIKSAYEGHNFAWMKTPKNHSLISFRFEKAIKIKSFLFKTGNHDHPGDTLKYGVVEVLTQQKYNSFLGQTSELREDKGITTIPDVEYVVVGVFNEKGLVTANIPASMGEIVELRIRVTLDVTENWVIISELFIKL